MKKLDDTFIGPICRSGSEFNQLTQYVGDVDPSLSSTEWQVRIVARKCSFFKYDQGPFKDRFNDYMIRNRAAIESCLYKFVLTKDQHQWEYDNLRDLEHFGVVIPEHFVRDALIRRRLSRR